MHFDWQQSLSSASIPANCYLPKTEAVVTKKHCLMWRVLFCMAQALWYWPSSRPQNGGSSKEAFDVIMAWGCEQQLKAVVHADYNSHLFLFLCRIYRHQQLHYNILVYQYWMFCKRLGSCQIVDCSRLLVSYQYTYIVRLPSENIRYLHLNFLLL